MAERDGMNYGPDDFAPETLHPGPRGNGFMRRGSLALNTWDLLAIFPTIIVVIFGAAAYAFFGLLELRQPPRPGTSTASLMKLGLTREAAEWYIRHRKELAKR